MITPIACINVINPLFTNPTTMTVVIELDWTTQVTATPTMAARMRLVGGHADHAPQASAGHGLHPLGHVFHAEQENAQATNQAEDHVPQQFLTHSRSSCLAFRIQTSRQSRLVVVFAN